MKKQFNKIDVLQDLFQIYPIRIKFVDTSLAYDFGKYFDSDLSRLFAKLFYDKCSKLTSDSRERIYGSICKFLKFLDTKEITKIELFNNTYLVSFALWLDTETDFSLNTKYYHYNEIARLLENSKKIKNSPFVLLKIPNNPFKSPQLETSVPKKLNETQLKKLLSICYEKIDFYLEEFRTAQSKMLEIKNNVKNGAKLNWKDKYNFSYHLLEKYGYMPQYREMSRKEQFNLMDIGGMDTIINYISPNEYLLLPFYIVLLFELAGNSDAVRLIDINCITPDPLFEDRAFIVWDKGRSGTQQKRNVFKKKKYGAYQIIEWVIELTKNTRKLVEPKDSNYLFIARGNSTKNKLSLVDKKRFNDNLKVFCEENLDFMFNPSDIRPSVLTEMYKNRKDIIGISKIANHKNLSTTLLYIVDEQTMKDNRKYLSEKQDNIIDSIVNKKSQITSNNENSVEGIGFTCKKPIVDNKACVNWMVEITNPDLIIPANSKYLSKIIALKNSILSIQKIIRKERFEILYEPILNIINNDIITKFNKDIIEESLQLAKTINLPILEEY